MDPREKLKEHVHDCRPCSLAQLRALFAIRPFMDNHIAASHLNDMCEEGKRLAILTLEQKNA